MKREGRSNGHMGNTVLALLIVAVLSVILGLLAGKIIISSDSTQGAQPLYNWGETVLVDGEMEPVASYLAKKLSAEDMKKNLQ